jgi:uroporphyrinogen decarboxylase
VRIRGLPSSTQAKKDFLNALASGPPGRVPYFEASFGRRHLERLLGATEVAAGWPTGRTPLIRTPPEWSIRVSQTLGIGFITSAFIWELGRIYEPGPEGNDIYAGGSLRERADIRGADPAAVEEAMQRLTTSAWLARSHDLATGFVIYGPLAIAQFAMGLDHFCLALYDDLDLVRSLLDAAIAVYVPLIESAAKIGIDFLLISDALCSKSGPMFDPKLIRELWRPTIQLYLDAARSRNIPVGLHSDGDNSALLDDFVQMGFQFLHPIEPCDGVFDIYKVRERVQNRLALAGNIDIGGVLALGTPEQVHDDVLEHMRRLAPAGGYMCGSSHEISDAIPPENFEAMIQAIHDTNYA